MVSLDLEISILLGYKFRPRPQAGLEAPQLSQTSSRKNGKPSISRMAQKIELIIRLFSGLIVGNSNENSILMKNILFLVSIKSEIHTEEN